MRSRLKDKMPRCIWTLVDEDSTSYETDCGHRFEFNVGTPAENKAVYCMYCGRILTVRDPR